MGPERITQEPVALYRMRYARYCLRWTTMLLLPLVLLFVFSPSIGSFPAPGFLMFLYIGLPLGFAVAVIAAFGFMVGGLWASTLERRPDIARIWPKVKVIVRSVVLSFLAFYGVHVIARGFIDKEVLMYVRGKGMPVAAFAQEPLSYLGSMVAWSVFAVGLLVLVYRELRRVYAT